MDSSIGIIVITLLLSAFFSGIEIAYYSANKLKLELKKKEATLSNRLLSYFTQHPSHFMTNTLVGNNIALVVYGIYMKQVLDGVTDHLGIEWLHYPFPNFVFITVVSSTVVLILAEFLPKALFRANPDRLLTFFSYPFTAFYYLFYPVNLFVVWLSRFLLKRIMRVDTQEDKPVFNHYDLFHFVNETNEEENNELDLDTEIFKNAIQFPHVKVRECMIPRTEMEAIEISQSIDTLKNLFRESGFSKIIVYRDNIDNVVGYVHIIDLYKNPESIGAILIPITIATESMPASDLLKILIDKQRSIAIVVDEFGGTSGIITIEDIIEEIFGEIRDEHDQEELVEKQLAPNEFLFSARFEIDYLNQQYQLNLPEGDYETLGGLILAIHENIPDENEVVYYNPYEFIITAVSGARIEEVKLKVHQFEEESA